MDIKVCLGDITTAKVDAIVNAANNLLQAGAGVCGAIFKACNHFYELQGECNKIGFCKTGEAVITNGYDLPAKYIIHTVGPVYRGDEDSVYLASAYKNSLILADEKKLTSIAFPSISTGIYGYPLEKAVKIAVDTIKNYNPKNLKECYIYCFDERTYQYFKNEI